jgi:predicted DNA-binding transcriptional regulator YafY
MSENKDGRGRKPNQRMQHFLVLQYLLEHSDANHYVKAKELLEYLKVSCDILVKERSLYKDIKEINIAYVMLEDSVGHEDAEAILEGDPDRETVKYKKKNGYYVAKRSLDPSDARLLVEALHTARFVTERDTEYIANQVGSFLSEYQREQIKHDKPIFEKKYKKGKDAINSIFPLGIQNILYFNRKLSAIIAINSEFVGFPLLF